MEPTKEYIKYRDMQKNKIEEQNLSDDSENSPKEKPFVDIIDEFLNIEKNDSYDFELQEREAYDTHKMVYDKKAFHM